MDKRTLKSIRKIVSYGDVTEISKKVGLSKGTISRWLNGYINTRKEPEIINAIATLQQQKKEKQQEMDRKIEELTKNIINPITNL